MEDLEDKLVFVSLSVCMCVYVCSMVRYAHLLVSLQFSVRLAVMCLLTCFAGRI